MGKLGRGQICLNILGVTEEGGGGSILSLSSERPKGLNFVVSLILYICSLNKVPFFPVLFKVH